MPLMKMLSVSIVSCCIQESDVCIKGVTLWIVWAVLPRCTSWFCQWLTLVPAGMRPGFPVTLTSLSQMNKNTFTMLLYIVQSILG